jgi:hypothetical protein
MRFEITMKRDRYLEFIESHNKAKQSRTGALKRKYVCGVTESLLLALSRPSNHLNSVFAKGRFEVKAVVS